MNENEHPHYAPDPEMAKQLEQEAKEFLEVGKSQIAETKESERARWQDKPVDQLKPADLLRLDEEGFTYVKELLNTLAIVQGRGRVAADLLTDTFFKVARELQRDFPDASIKELLALGDEEIKSRVSKLLPENIPQNPEDIKMTESVKEDIRSSAKLLRLNIQMYAAEHGNLLAEPSGIASVVKTIRKSVIGESEQDREQARLRESLQEQITFLNHLEEDPEILLENFDYDILSVETDRKNLDEKIVRTLKLPYAIQYGSIYIPSLTAYMDEVRHPSKILGRMIQDKVVKAFQMVSEGYAEKEFTAEDSIAQFKSGTMTSPGGGNYAGMSKGVVKEIRVLKAIGSNDVGAS